MRMIAIALALLLEVLATPAMAESKQSALELVGHIFATADKDGNGALTREEYADAGLERFGVPFDDCDADADGETTLDEYLDLYARHHGDADRVAL